MKKRIKRAVAGACLCMGSILSITTLKVYAQQKISYRGRTIATVAKDGVMTYIPKSGDNATDLEYLLNNDNKKELILPKKSTIYINQVVDIGSNTTIKAAGATVIQTTASKGLIKHNVDGSKYNAIENVRIEGGTWKNKENTKGHTFIRFAHGRKLVFKNMTIVSNYQSHALELIACKDVKVWGCTMKAENNGTKTLTSVEDAIQIDVATPKTAPGVLKETKQIKYVSGQICKDIRIENCNVYGARGICANFAASAGEFEKFKNCYHRNITIANNTITGATSQGIALYNTINCVIKGNTIKTYCTRLDNYSYPSAVNLYLFGTNPGGTNDIRNNKIYGVRRGIYITSKTKSSYYGKTIVIENDVFIKPSIKQAMCLDIRQCRSYVQRKNKLNRW